jgi:uncharacterized RDD family membrane protein YckC
MKLASPVRRLSAYALDCLVLFGGLLLLQAALIPVNPILAMQRDGRVFTGAQLHFWVFATATVPFLLYFAFSIASRRQATPAMRWLRMRVDRVEGGADSISPGRALIRTVVLLLPFELNHTVMFQMPTPPASGPGLASSIGIAVVWILLAIYAGAAVLTRQRQSVHDLVAGTVVVDVV